jgi:alkanesulfonate monooxygenase SsuD/methylene tetrahydromethanopterin reductase-like flavin-dependent oxidoreductase (luciferase family)
MRFGIFGGATRASGGPPGDSQGYHEYIDYVLEAEQLGYDGVYLVEHHFTGRGQLSASLGLLTYLAARTSRIRLGTAVVVMPWHHPVLLAEQAATLDVLSGGRLDLGVGKGYRFEEFHGFGIPMEEAEARFDEAMQVLRTAWTTEGRFSHHGRYWQLEDVIVEPRPVQTPHPPLWLGAGSTASIQRAAREGYRLFLDQTGTFELTAERVAVYRAERERLGETFQPGDVAVTRSLAIARTAEERERRIEERARVLEMLRSSTLLPGQNAADAASAASRPFYVDPAQERENTEQSAILGTPEECVERLERLAAGGVDYVLFANPPIEDLRIFAREVMPALAASAAH